MATTAPTIPLAQADRLAQRIREHEEEVARMRAQMGDPQKALFRFVTERFEVQALILDDRDHQESRIPLWEDDDELNAR